MTNRNRNRNKNKNKNGQQPNLNMLDCNQDRQDRLTKLPNDVLLNILERLDTPDGVKTCILSKKMSKLPMVFSRFVIDATSFAPKDNSGPLTPRDVTQINGTMADATNNILNFRSHHITISQLTLRFYLRYYDCLSIGKTVARTMATQNVEMAEFSILTEKVDQECTVADLHSYAKQFNTFVGACPDAFAGLTRLQIGNMRFGESDIPNILRTCKRLESLRFSNCDSGVRTVLQVEHARLIELEISYGTFEVVELNHVPKLQRMIYETWVSRGDPLTFGYVPRLSWLSLINTCVSWHKTINLSQLLANVPSITDLHLSFESEKIWVQPEHRKNLAPVFNKLRRVNLVDLPEGYNITWTMFILEAASSLEEMCITVWDHWCEMVTDEGTRKNLGYCEKMNVKWEPCASGFKHRNLVKLTIFGFQPDDIFFEFIRCVMDAAVNLEEVSLYDRKVCPECPRIRAHPSIEGKVSPSRYPQTMEEKALLKEQIAEGMGVTSPAVIYFRS